jgi:hypothetical protein
MTFATVKENQASAKFHLIRLEPARYVNDSLVLNAGLYEMTFPYVISKIKANGTVLNKVSGTPLSGEFSYNETTKLLKVNSTPSSNNAIVVYYYLFYTGDRFRVFNENPDDLNSSPRDYEPKLLRFPTFSQSVENIINGKLSLSSSSIQLIMNNGDFMNYLGDNDSFYQKEIKAWLCLDSTSNIQKVFEGKIIDVKTTRNSITLRVDDNLGVLNQPCFLKDNSSEVYYNLSDIPTLDTNKNNYPRRFIFGSVSRYQTINTPVATFQSAMSLDCDSLNEAVCISYNSDITTSNNRQFGICRTKDGFIDFEFTPSSVDNTNANHTILNGTNPQISKFHIGDTFKLDDGITPYYERVLYVDKTLNRLIITKNASVTASHVVKKNNCPSVVIKDGTTQYYPIAERDYTIQTTATSGGNKSLNITFANNFEATLSMPTLNPTSMRIGYKVSPDTTNANHSDALKFILQSVGINCDSISFANSKSSLSSYVNFSVPNFDETDYKNVYDYAEDILSSTLGYLSLGNDFNVKYLLFNVPSSTSQITDTEILEDTFNIDFDYNDIVNRIIAYNPHYSSIESVNSSATSDYSNKARYLHGTDKTIRFRHCLEDMTLKIADHISFKSKRKASYFFDTKTINLDSIIGDEFLLKKSNLPSGDSSRSVKIIGIEKGTQSGIIATDFKG